MALVETNRGRSSMSIGCALVDASIISCSTASRESNGMEDDATADTEKSLLLAGFKKIFKQLSLSITDVALAASFKEAA